MDVWIMFAFTFVFYTIMVALAISIQEQVNKINKNLQRYFEKIRYSELNKLLKEGKANAEYPPQD